MSYISISIPAYNESETIGPLVKESLSVLAGISENHEVFVINDGSSDSTSDVVKKIALENPRVKLYEHPRNLGFGATIREIYTLPESEWIFFIPGDGQIPPGELLKLYPHRNESQFILGYRKERNDSGIRKINSWCHNLFISIIAGKRVHDVDSVGLIKRECLKGVTLKSKSAFIHAEIFLEVVRKGGSVKEIEIAHKPRMHGQSSGSNLRVILSTIMDMLKYIAGRFFHTS